eukprot:2058038-Amphidinium_carterae.1
MSSEPRESCSRIARRSTASFDLSDPVHPCNHMTRRQNWRLNRVTRIQTTRRDAAMWRRHCAFVRSQRSNNTPSKSVMKVQEKGVKVQSTPSLWNAHAKSQGIELVNADTGDQGQACPFVSGD